MWRDRADERLRLLFLFTAQEHTQLVAIRRVD